MSTIKNQVLSQLLNEDGTINHGFNSGGYLNHAYVIMADFGIVSLKAVSEEYQKDPSLFEFEWDLQWWPIAYEINYEDQFMLCDHTNEKIDPVYDIDE